MRNLRKKKEPKLTQKALAEAMELPITTLRNWEQGRVAPPAYIRKLVEAFLNSYGG